MYILSYFSDMSTNEATLTFNIYGPGCLLYKQLSVHV